MKLHAATSTDGYKISHGSMYPVGTTHVYSNLTPRSDHHYAKNATSAYDGRLVWVGAQGMVKEITENWEKFFSMDRNEAINKYAKRLDGYLGGFDSAVEKMSALHDLQYLPLLFKSLPEGCKVPMGVPVLTVTNTHPDFFWLVNYLETSISALTWKTATTATVAAEYKAICNHYAELTGTDDFTVSVQCHDFSMRGMSGIEDAARSGFGHLTQFIGTDSLVAMDYADDYYDSGDDLIAISVPATEHAVATSNILFNENECSQTTRLDAEMDFLEELITERFPTGIISYVSDSYDFWSVITKVLPLLKDVIMARQPSAVAPAKLVCRPDCYSEDTSILTPSGWKLFSELSLNDRVAQVLDNGSYEFVHPERIIDQEYEGHMHHFKDHHGKVDLLVTPNHRMVLLQGGNERIVEAEKLKEKGNWEQKMFRSAESSAPHTKMTDMERLKVAFQADGSFVTGQITGIRFSFSKDRKMERLREILGRIGLLYKEYSLSDGRVEFHIKVDATQFSKDLEWIEFDNLDSNWASECIEEISHWDSSIRNSGRFKFDTTTKSVAEKVELIAIAAGKGVLMSKSEDNRKEHFKDIYTLHILDDNRVGGQSWRNEEVDYSGRVYCVTVPSGKVLVKRNRCTMVSGNSGDPVKVITGHTVLDMEFDTEEEFYAHTDTSCTFYHVSSGKEVVKVGGQYRTFDMVDPSRFGLGDVVPECEANGAVECLWNTFGGTETDRGFKLLDSHIGLIYGDSITPQRAEQILHRLMAKGFASGNVVLGVGSMSYQFHTRDTFGFAVKATHITVDGVGLDIFKDPKGEPSKKSAKGLLYVDEDAVGDLELIDCVSPDMEASPDNMLQPMWKDNKWLKRESLTSIRARVKKYM